jgi:hypothetical protein
MQDFFGFVWLLNYLNEINGSILCEIWLKYNRNMLREIWSKQVSHIILFKIAMNLFVG